MRAFFIQNFGAKPNVTREKLPKKIFAISANNVDEIDSRWVEL
jgi:hypothetical protein